MIGDIQKSIELAELKYPDGTTKGAPNILIALGLSCYTEYWGRLLTGIATGEGIRCFNAFFDKLGQPYVNVRNGKNEIYRKVRCGLAHTYLIEENSIIDMKPGLPCGIEYNIQTTYYTFHIPTYFEHFKNAVNDYISGLEVDTEKLSLMEQALTNKPELA